MLGNTLKAIDGTLGKVIGYDDAEHKYVLVSWQERKDWCYENGEFPYTVEARIDAEAMIYGKGGI